MPRKKFRLSTGMDDCSQDMKHIKIAQKYFNKAAIILFSYCISWRPERKCLFTITRLRHFGRNKFHGNFVINEHGVWQIRFIFTKQWSSDLRQFSHIRTGSLPLPSRSPGNGRYRGKHRSSHSPCFSTLFSNYPTTLPAQLRASFVWPKHDTEYVQSRTRIQILI